MRVRDGEFIPSLIIETHQISPEALRAQRLAELKDIAEYRARRLQSYKNWSDPVKRAERIQKAQEELIAARKIWADMLTHDLKKLEMHMPSDAEKFQNKIMVRVLEKASPYKPWWRRFWDWLTG